MISSTHTIVPIVIFEAMKANVKGVIVGLLLLIEIGNAEAQTQVPATIDALAQARTWVLQKNYPQAIEAYKKLYAERTGEVELYQEYLQTLIAAKSYKDAEKLTEKQLSLRPQDPIPLVDAGYLYLLNGKEKKAKEYFVVAISRINGDDMITTRMATAFSRIEQIDWAIKTYERAIAILHNPFLYGYVLARLYAQNGEIEKSVATLLDAGPRQIGTAEDTKSLLLEVLNNQPKHLALAQKAVVKKINESPENIFYAEILTWLYTQKDDWEGALIQIQALDERNNENGQRLLEFARLAQKEKKFDIAVEALNAILEYGKERPLYATAWAEKLQVSMTQLTQNIAYTKRDVLSLEKHFEDYFKQFPEYTTTETLLQYAALEAQYNDSSAKAVTILEKAIAQPEATKNFLGRAKLQLGDYYILTNRVWDASLTYSQVDKAFKEDMLGEEARFRNAKLAYYRGDFEWAESQLSVLKASTSELIANDALSLSVLIIENIPPDSNIVPLQQFAHADLLLFQNKDKEAERILDSITTAFPKHPLQDDILMLRANIAIKHRAYDKAIAFYKTVLQTFGEDVLGDDALYKMADTYERYLQQPLEAQKYYEELLLKYPGSTYVQIARRKLTHESVPF